VAAGRVDLRARDHEAAWRRLRSIPGIGAWTVEMLALHGQGRYDQLPAADVGYLRLVGRLLTGDPRAKASEDEVRALFAPYGRWAALAAAHALGPGALRPPERRPAAAAPRPAGTPSSAPWRSPAAA
jgi:3-methyladenine DNA glycosylase/8-oxoguanine DNA glycosylase